MKHSFLIGQLDPSKCAICKRDMIDHTNRATCESCGNSGLCNINFGDTLLCEDCEAKDEDVKKNKDKVINEIRQRISEENGKINISTDIFNAEVTSINDIIKELSKDESIQNKNFALAQILDVRFKHLSDVIFNATKERSEAENKQRAIQVTYNELSKRLRAEEREAIKLKDINYQPVKPKLEKTKSIKTKKYDAKSIRIAAHQSGIAEQILSMMCMAHNISVEEAVKKAKEAGL